MQRFFDIVFSAAALLVLSPLLVPLAIALRLTGEGEVFFMQPRVGRGGRVFGLYKFATMLKNSPSIGTGDVTVRNDPRILPMGRFLRKTKINELPQLLNIFKGDMSVVGPRPLTERSFKNYSSEVQTLIAKVRPGLSGIGSIVFRDEEEMVHGHEDPMGFYDKVITPYKGELERWYVAHSGLRTYFVSIALTVWVMLAPSSPVVWRAFKTLPRPPAELAAALGATN